MEASSQFFFAVAMAYFIPSLLTIGLIKIKPGFLGETACLEDLAPPKNKWLDFVVAILVIASILGLGGLYRNGYLLPDKIRDGQAFNVMFLLNNFVIYLPLFVALVIRHQSLKTIYISTTKIENKLLAGILMAILGCLIFYGLTKTTNRISQDLETAFSRHSLQFFPPVFLEGAGVAFVFVRLRWITSKWVAILIPAFLFAIAHLHYSIEAGKSFVYTISFFLFNVGIVSGLLFMLQRVRDILWIGILHYFMDVAINAFNQ